VEYRVLKTAAFFAVGAMFMMAILPRLGSAQTVGSSNTAQENPSDLLRSDKAAFARLKSLVNSELSSAERQQFNRSFAGFGLRNAQPGSPCSDLHFLGQVRKVPEGRGADKLDAVLEICVVSTFWAAHTTLIALLLQSVLSPEEIATRGDALIRDLAKYQRSMADDILLDDITRLPMCPEIWVTYFLAKYGRIGDCRGNGKTEYSPDAVAWLALRMNDNARQQAPDLKVRIPTDQREFMEFIEEMKKYITRMTFDRIVLHEIGHIVMGHHRVSREEEDAQRERTADKFAANKKPEDEMEQFLKYFVNAGLATHVGMHLDSLSKTTTFEVSRVENTHLACETLKVPISIDIEPAIKALFLQSSKRLSCP